MKLLTKAQHAKLFANGKASAIKEQDHFPVVKLFTHDDHAEIPFPDQPEMGVHDGLEYALDRHRASESPP